MLAAAFFAFMAVMQLVVNLTTSYDIENQGKGAGAYGSQG